MRKHLLPVLFLLVAAAIWWVSASDTLRHPFTTNGEPLVVVSGYVPYTLLKELGGDRVAVRMLIPPGAEPHAFEPTPGALVSVKNADVFVYLSDRLEPWARELTVAKGSHTQVLELAPTAEGEDPHVWMRLQGAEALAERLTQMLTSLAPAHRAYFEENLTRFRADLHALQQDYQQGLAQCASGEVIHIGHLAFSPLTAQYGLAFVALSGSGHTGEQSAQKVAGLIAQIRAHHTPAVFTEEAVSARLAQTVARETGAAVLPLYPVEHISKKDFERGVTYIQLMRRNLKNLMRGLQCQVS